VLDELVRHVEQARALPMSASAVVHRGELLELLDRLRAVLPVALDRAHAVLGEQEAILAQGRQEVERMREQAREELARLVAASTVRQEAQAEAERLRGEAQQQAEAMRREVEDYVDGKLANFEIVLGKTLATVTRGRARLSGQTELDDLREDEP
jgi:cell division septum initiation protein DivIVA